MGKRAFLDTLDNAVYLVSSDLLALQDRKDFPDNQDSQDNQDSKDPRETKVTPDPQDLKFTLMIWEHMSKDPQVTQVLTAVRVTVVIRDLLEHSDLQALQDLFVLVLQAIVVFLVVLDKKERRVFQANQLMALRDSQGPLDVPDLLVPLVLLDLISPQARPRIPVKSFLRTDPQILLASLVLQGPLVR